MSASEAASMVELIKACHTLMVLGRKRTQAIRDVANAFGVTRKQLIYLIKHV